MCPYGQNSLDDTQYRPYYRGVSTKTEDLIRQGSGINYPERVQDLCDFAMKHYGMEQANMRVLAASLIPCAPNYPAWIACESNKHTFWSHWGNALRRLYGVNMQYLSFLRSLRPRYANATIADMLDDSRTTPNTLVDTRWDLPMSMPHPRSRYIELNAACLRMQVPLAVHKQPHIEVESELYRLARLAINPEHRTMLPKPIAKVPEMLNVAVHYLGLLNPELTDAANLMANLCILPPAHAVLHGRTSLETEDHLALLMVMQNSIRRWTWRILIAFAEAGGTGALDLSQLMIDTLLPKPVIFRECSRLAECGILDWPKLSRQGRRKRWIRPNKEVWPDVERFMSGDLVWW